MFISQQDRFSGTTTAAGVTTGDAITATAISVNVMDLRQSTSLALADEAINEHDMWWTVLWDTAAAAVGAATVTTTLESDSAVGLGASPVVHFTTPADPKATLIAGFVQVQTQLPSGARQLYKRFLGVRYTVATGPLTAGSALSWLSFDVPRIIAYPIAFTIDV